jgi:hypothetical protein
MTVRLSWSKYSCSKPSMRTKASFSMTCEALRAFETMAHDRRHSEADAVTIFGGSIAQRHFLDVGES